MSFDFRLLWILDNQVFKTSHHQMSFGFTYIGKVCITQTWKFMNHIWWEKTWRPGFDREITRNLKTIKRRYDFNLQVFKNWVWFSNDIRNLTNIRNFYYITAFTLFNYLSQSGFLLFKIRKNLIKKWFRVAIFPKYEF